MPSADHHKRAYRASLKIARSALTHDIKLSALRGAARARRFLIGQATVADYDNAAVICRGTPNRTGFFFTQRMGAA